MSTPEGLCNLALDKLGMRDRVANLAAPSLPIERHFYVAYPHYRNVELARHRWRFARGYWTVTKVAGITDDPDRPYRYLKPPDMLAPWRDDDTEWVVSGDSMFSAYAGPVKFEGTKLVPEAQFDPLFDEVLATRLALETLDWPTVTEAKRKDSKDWYIKAIGDAQRANSIIQRPRSISYDDNQFDWIVARYR